MPLLGPDPRERGRFRRGDDWRGGGVVMATDRTANVTWNGSLLEGAGTIDSVGQRRLRPAGRHVGVARRGAGGQDEPRGADRGRARGLLLDGALARPRQAGTPPERLSTSATVTFQPGEGITRSRAHRPRTRPGIDAAGFAAAGRGGTRRVPGLQGARRRPRDHGRGGLAVAATVRIARAGSRPLQSPPWPRWISWSRSSSARTRRRRSACPTLPSTTITARRPTPGGG